MRPTCTLSPSGRWRAPPQGSVVCSGKPSLLDSPYPSSLFLKGGHFGGGLAETVAEPPSGRASHSHWLMAHPLQPLVDSKALVLRPQLLQRPLC